MAIWLTPLNVTKVWLAICLKKEADPTRQLN